MPRAAGAIPTLALSLSLVATAPSAAEPSEASRVLAAVLDDLWQRQLDRVPTLRIEEGLPADRLPDLSVEALVEDAAFAKEILARLEAIDAEELTHEEAISTSVALWYATLDVEAPNHFWDFFQVSPYSWAFSGVGQTLSNAPVATAEQRQRYLGLVDQLPSLVATVESNLRVQMELGVVMPKAEIDAVVPIFRAWAAAGDANPAWVAAGRLGGADEEERAAFEEELARRIGTFVVPAFAALADLLDGPYREAAPETVGMAQYPGGPGAYRWAVRRFTTTDLSPEEIHRLGIERMDELEERMAAVRHRVGFQGTAREFHEALRRDPRFLAATPEEVGERLTAPIRRIEPLVDRFFGRTPKAGYGVERLDPALEGSMTFGYYQEPTTDEPVGRYLYNGSRLEERPLIGAAALIYHELVPGHHFQIALQRENESLPRYRQESFNSAFVEGWADYAAELGFEMGLYDDPWDEYGRLAQDLFLTCRLVVDTGMNALGWSRERATALMTERLLESPTQIATETLRYSVDMPGQALAYKIGSLTLWRLRREAEETLGDRFDLREFHDLVLGSGALPLAVLEEHVAWWVAGKKAVRPDGQNTSADPTADL